MLKPQKHIWTLLLLVLLAAGAITAQDYEEEEYEEPGARVARISFLKGESKIKRIDSEEWEEVVDNLPIVEGDTIETLEDTKLEIQLDRYSFLRLNEGSILKFTFLADDGVALSLSKGALLVTLIKFENQDTYLEIDAPKSTVAIKKSGTYRIDAGDETAREVRVAVRDEGEARVYSQDSGFALRDGRTARLFLEGNYSGEWDTSRTSNVVDGFDDWSNFRNQEIAASFQTDDDDDYYDSDIYGADDLDRYGDWVYISDYGNVWRPSSRAIASYLNWSPYRYGSWRWLPYYGWTWVNDEPWGWATYHYGRWIYHRGRWYWSPHQQYRRSRSWWRPALVFVTYIGNNYCWYPLPYGYRYYNYNRRYRNRWNGRRRHRRRNDDKRGGGDDRRGGGDRKNPDPDRKTFGGRKFKNQYPTLKEVPAKGIVTVKGGQFGNPKNRYGTPTLDVAKKVLRKKPIVTDSPPILPDRKFDRNVKVQTADTKGYETKTGAVQRKSFAPLDEKLRKEKIYGNRTPAKVPAAKVETKRKTPTGVFDRKRKNDSKGTGYGPVYTSPVRSTSPKPKSKPAPQTRSTERKKSPPVTKKPRSTYVPRAKKPERKSSPPPRRSSPPAKRSSPPARRSSPKRSAPKRSAPTRSAPKRSAPKRSAPKKSAPKSKPKTSSSSRKKTSSKLN